MIRFKLTKLKSSRHKLAPSTTAYYIPSIIYPKAFTIVELLVVIVVIAILAAITIVSFTGISQKATATSLQSDLSSAKKQIALYYVEHGAYPVDLDSNKCPRDNTTPTPITDTKYCLKSSSGNVLDYNLPSPTSLYTLTNTNTASTTVYSISNNISPTPISNLVASDPTNWKAIGTQVWAKANLNVGDRIDGANNQTNNSVVEKYCYADNIANCTAYGALYQWDEAMQYVTTSGAQGICPTGSHIPTDAEYNVLEMQLGMTQAAANTTAWRGTDQGTQLKSGGISGLNIPLVGHRSTSGSFGLLSSYAYLWSSSQNGATIAWRRYLNSGYTTVFRDSSDKNYGFSIRCVGN